MIKVALPNKGQLFEPTTELLKSCGYNVKKSERALSCVDADNNIEFFFLRPSDIPMYVGQGIIDLGVTGIDFNVERRSPAVKVMDLHFGHSRLCAAVPNESPYVQLEEIKNLRIATSFPGIAKSFFKKEDMHIVELEGAVEISVGLGVADAVIDIVSSGATLKQAGLRIIGEPLFHSNAALFAHPDSQNRPQVETMVKRIQGKLVALNYMMVEYDVPAALLEQACELTPGLDSPTISTLHNRDWYAVKAMVQKREANLLMDKLSEMGCRSILLSQIESARI
jgi:ATP phosphoribosyltransferase